MLRRKTLARLALTGWFTLPLALARAARRFAGADLVYINTSVVLDYQTRRARLSRQGAAAYPRDPDRPRPQDFARGRRCGAARGSSSTRAPPATVSRRPPDAPARSSTTASTGRLRRCRTTYDGQRPLRVALIGRINRIKGQDVLLAALKRLPAEVSDRIEARMVGGAFENPALEAKLRDDVAAAGLSGRVSVEPFVADTAPIYAWADVVVAPSKLPESLGRTAIEAMSFGRPALVSAIGGLTEVVADGETGWHVPPGDAEALAARLEAIVARPEEWRGFSAKARARYEAVVQPQGRRRGAGRRRRAHARARPRRRPAGAGGQDPMTFPAIPAEWRRLAWCWAARACRAACISASTSR